MARRRGSRSTALIFLLVAVLAAGVFAFLFVTTVRGLERELEQASQEEEKQQIVVASHELVQGVTLREEDLDIVELPETFIPDGIFQYREDVIGRVPRERILPGEFIREDRLADAESGVGLNAIIPRGMRAVSININDGSAVSGFLNPGNYVDVLVTIQDDERTEKTVTLLQATRVLAVDSRLGSGSADGRSSDGTNYKPSVTLAVTPEQAEKLAHSQIEGDVTLTLRNDIDVTQVETHGTDAARLIGTEQVALETIAPTPKPRPVEQERDRPQDLLIIRGSKVEERDPRPGRGRRR